MPKDRTGHFYYAWFPTIFEGKTQHLTLAEDGAYRRLIDHYMLTRHPLPIEDRALARICGCSLTDWLGVKDEVMKFFVLSDQGFTHEFCDETLTGDTQRILRAQQNGRGGGRPKTQDKAAVNPPVTQSVHPTQNNQNKYTPLPPIRVGRDFKNGNGGEGGLVPTRLRECLPIWAPGFDPEAICNDYAEYVKGHGLPKNIDKAFPVWVQGWVDNRKRVQ